MFYSNTIRFPHVNGLIVLKLSEPHLSFLKQSMDAVGLYSSELLKVENGFAKVSFKRTILQTNTKGVNSRNSNNRFRSKCEINGKQVTLKVLRSIAKPLITIVDASAASSALSQNKARIAIIDTGVPNNILSKVKSTKKVYRDARKKREDIEREIENRVMPASFNAADGDENIELLQHWIDELDDFEKRLSTFQESIASSRNAASLLNSDENNDGDVDFEDDFDINDDYSNGSLLNGPSSFLDTLKGFISCSWEQDKVSLNKGSSVESSFYSNLLDLRDGIKGLDSQLTSAIASCDALSSLSSVSSVASALETSRKYLFDSTIGSEGDSALNRAAEQSHELLNKLEDALSSCATFMSDHPSGLVSTIEKMRGSVSVSVEDIDVLIADWGSLARKHGVSPYSLPPLHNSLRQELDGNVEARLLLPKAKKDESVALDDFVNACKELSEARQSVCLSLTESVTSRLKDLGMTGSTFTSQLKQNAYKCTDSSAYSDSATLGTDSIDFILTHRNSGQTSEDNNQNNMGNLDVIGSSGEKARLLLAIETDLPGSVGASCNSLIMNNDSIEGLDELTIDNPGPVSVIYDEIDAHVGGNAAVSVAKLLSDQTQLRKSGSLKRSQIVSITHSPSLAAIADRHIVVQKLISNDIIESKDSVSVLSVQGVQRLQEISRMASGDLAIEESIQFAEGLLRDSMKYKQDQAERITNVN